MGYTITIGKKTLSPEYEYELNDLMKTQGLSKEEAENEVCAMKYEVFEETHDDAPSFGEPTDYTNERWPSYSGWRKVCEAANIIDLFYEGNEFKGGHPGYFVIDQDFVNNFNLKYKDFKEKYPTAKPTYGGNSSPDINGLNANEVLVRLEWLKYWINYSFEKYENPIIGNS